MSDPLILKVQTNLKAAGFSPGPLDGIPGPMTRTATVLWQRAHGLSPSGLLDAATLKSLGIDAAAPIPWLAEATRLMGLKEGAGAKDNHVILDWADDLDLAYPHDDIAWCGLFVAHCIRTGLPDEPLPANPLGARNYLKFGRSVHPQLGAIGVFWRGDRNGWLGHVGLLVAESAKAFCVRGGNQSDSVRDAWISKDRLLDARWPITGPAQMNRKLPSQPAGVLSTNEA